MVAVSCWKERKRHFFAEATGQTAQAYVLEGAIVEKLGRELPSDGERDAA
jgi:hypothetical protein